MKTRVLIFSIIGFMTFSSCNQSADASSMLDNPETRNEIFNTIAGNHDMMTSFMETIQTNDHAMQMMQDSKMMSNMMKGDGMQMMMKDGTMMSNMMQMMHKNGMMSDECMQAMTQMMDEKGMGNMPQEEHH